MKTVLTSGCFDILHPGHIQTLQNARNMGDQLVVALNSDDSIRRLKGKSRPINDYTYRAFMLNQLPMITRVIAQTQMCSGNILGILKPDVFYKAGYTLEQLSDKERAMIDKYNICFYSGPVYGSFSTTKIIQKIQQLKS